MHLYDWKYLFLHNDSAAQRNLNQGKRLALNYNAQH